MLSRLFSFQGGIHPDSHKQESRDAPIRQAPLPERLTIPLAQSAGKTARPVVAVGDKVLKGERIGAADDWISASVHASTSGRVLDIAPCPMPHPSGLAALSVVIEPDGEERWIEREPVAYEKLSPEEVFRCLQEFGIVGLGGAVFPSHVKLKAALRATEDLILNGAECEPFITCDDRLMQERAGEIVSGIGILADLLQPRRVLIAIEENKPEAIRAMRDAVQAADKGFRVAVIPTIYPTGSLKQLIRVLTGREIPARQLPTDLGVQCFNIATAFSIWRALHHGEPLIRRVVTLTGNVARPGNWETAIGTPIGELLALAEPRDDTDGIIMGGPMMGTPLPEQKAPIIKASNCLIARSPALFPPRPEMPCIRCGSCARACPQELQPYELYWWSRARQFERLADYHLQDCIECGCCAYVCPANIPLVQYFRFAKGEIRVRAREEKNAEQARERFEFRQFREAREKAEKAEKLAKAAAAQAAKLAEAREKAEKTAPDAAPASATTTTAASPEEAGKAAVAAAVARAHAEPVAQETSPAAPTQETEARVSGPEKAAPAS
ncbi:MAG: electron transport complex subunit RsxC [Zoogloeaceae bacterium]|jgi:electron transport complex protein RnfC|nr:electron transport complex subunit RsxC [Zoogloeaceae bacterium]